MHTTHCTSYKTQHKHRETPAQQYHTLYNSLPLVTDSSFVKTPICTEFSQRAYCMLLISGRWGDSNVATPLVPLHSQIRTCTRWLLSQLCSRPSRYWTHPPTLHTHTQYRITHDIHSLEYLWTRPVAVTSYWTRAWCRGPYKYTDTPYDKVSREAGCGPPGVQGMSLIEDLQGYTTTA